LHLSLIHALSAFLGNLHKLTLKINTPTEFPSKIGFLSFELRWFCADDGEGGRGDVVLDFRTADYECYGGVQGVVEVDLIVRM